MGRYQPALLGGLFIGVLSALPLVNLGNLCCCLWVVCGGVLVTYLLQQNSPTPIATSEAALQGLMAGAIGGAVLLVAQFAMAAITGPLILEQLRQELSKPDVPPEVRDFMVRLLTPQTLALLGIFITIPLYAVFAMAGSFLGVAFFRKKLPPQPQA